jgi:hypothetical protein
MKGKVTASLLLSGLVLGIVGVMALNFPLAPVGAAPGARRLNQTTVYLDPVADAYVSEGAPTTNFGSDTRLDVQNLDGEIPEDRRSYVGFDLSSIPSNAIISSAAFKAHLHDAQGLSNVYIELRRVTSPWAYNTVTWNNKPSSNSYTGMYVDTRIGMKGWDVTGLVQGYWINRDFGTSPNFGLELRGPESGAYYLRSFTSNNASSNRPYLVVSYELPTPTPTSTPESDFSDLDLAMVTVMNSNDFVDPEPFTVVQGARFRLSVFVSIITEFSDGMETFDRDDVQVKVSGSQQEAIGDQDPNGQSTFSMIRTLGNGEPTLFVGDYWTTTLLDPGLYHEHLRVVFPSQPGQLNDDGVQFQSTFSDMQTVRPDWVSNVIDVQLPRLRYIQNQYNDHVDPQQGYAAEYLSPGRDNDSTFLVYTFDVSTEYLNPGLWTMNVVVDEPGIIAEFNEGNCPL